MLNAPKVLSRPIRVYFTFFIVMSVLILGFVNYELYQDGHEIRERVLHENQLAAEKEMRHVLDKNISALKDRVRAVADWDEVYQQLYDPSYYFFWHDERLKETEYFHPSFDSLELYNKDKELLMPASYARAVHFFLPTKIEDLSPKLLFKDFTETHINLFEPIYERGGREVIGYVGVSVDLLDYLLESTVFYYVDRATILISGQGSHPLEAIYDSLNFEPIANPVNEKLWELIKLFMVEMLALLSFLAIVFYVFFNITIYSAITSLSDYVSRLKGRNNEEVEMPKVRFFLKEFEDLKRSIHDYDRDLQNAHTELDHQNQIVWEQARRDVLTNIFNRRAFDEAWTDVVYGYSKSPTETYFLLFDCDFFKALNDTYGHEVGDEVIRLTAETIQHAMPLEAPAYRIGGDEFAVIMQNKSIEKVRLYAEACLEALKNANFSQLGIKESVSFSVGISYAMPGYQNDVAGLPRQADLAMYNAKKSLQQKIQFYDESFEKDGHSLTSAEILNRVMEAVSSGEGIQMHYQPIHSLDGQELYFESLVRVTKAGGQELIFPNDIFQVVQRRRVEAGFDVQVINAVLNDLRKGKIPSHTGVSINVSAKTLLRPDFVAMFSEVKEFLTHYKIVIEVTENALIDHMDYAKEVLNQLREQGFLIALDDFGSGYSSIRYLAHMPVDIIKFDRSLVLALCDSDPKTKKIVETTAAMIIDAHYQLVMEGIEDSVMMAQAVEAGATHLQGYLLGKPQSSPNPENQVH